MMSQGLGDEAPDTPVAFGRYTLFERLAVGGMAEVFRAKITAPHGFEKVLVIKRILPHLAQDPSFVEMFIDEAKLTARLAHPKIVQLLDFGQVRGHYFTALEYVDGFDALALLRMAAQKRVHVPPPIAVYIVSEILEALDYAHNACDMDGRAMQIVHRDISPSNIFISNRGDVKLGDFGIALARPAPSPSPSVRREPTTRSGTLKGKYGYMSPEQVVGYPVDARSDLFAIGIVLAELLTGRRLFTGTNDLDVLLKVRDVELERLDRYGANIPAPLNRLLRRALERKPRDRYQTAAALRDDLGEYLRANAERVGAPDLRAFAALIHGDGVVPGRSAGGRNGSVAGPRSTARLGPPGTAAEVTSLSRPTTQTDVDRFASAAPARPPDTAGDLTVISPTRLTSSLALANETGLLCLERADKKKEISFVSGSLQSARSNDPDDRLGELLVRRGHLSAADRDFALSMLPHHGGKLGDALVAFGMTTARDVGRMLLEQQRGRVLDVLSWAEGSFAFYRGEGTGPGLDPFEVLGAGAAAMDTAIIERRFASSLELRPIATRRSRLTPEAFRIGPTPREVLAMIDGTRSLGDWLAGAASERQRAILLRTLYLLIESDLVELA